IDVDVYEAYELVHPAYARQVLAVAETLPVFATKSDQTILDVGRPRRVNTSAASAASMMCVEF
ncbi:hypothetical protein H7D62_016435, partial [Brucella melitensis]|uniref:hypothetical protein n=1 Tax=Brucella melitensis TaxID=29459 RepID=UPI001AA07E47